MESKDIGTTTFSLGIRICGLNVHDISKNEIVLKDKAWGKSITDSTMLDQLKFFFSDGFSVRKDIVKYFVEKLQVILGWWKKQSVFCLYSSSLFFSYDASNRDCIKANLKFIDFAHVVPIINNTHDENMIIGLQNLINLLEQILD